MDVRDVSDSTDRGNFARRGSGMLYSGSCSYIQVIPDPDPIQSSLGRYVFGSEISYNKAPPRLPGLGC